MRILGAKGLGGRGKRVVCSAYGGNAGRTDRDVGGVARVSVPERGAVGKTGRQSHRLLAMT